MNGIHKEVSGLVSDSLKKATDKHNKKTNVQKDNFRVGDFVLVRRAHKKGHKLQFMWRGSRKILSVKSEWVYEVVDILNFVPR